MTHLICQRLSHCLIKYTCAMHVKYDPSRNSPLVVARLFLGGSFLLVLPRYRWQPWNWKADIRGGSSQHPLSSTCEPNAWEHRWPLWPLWAGDIFNEKQSKFLQKKKKRKKILYECGFAPNTRQSESTMGMGRLPKSLLEQVPAARAGSPLPLGH